MRTKNIIFFEIADQKPESIAPPNSNVVKASKDKPKVIPKVR